MVYNVTILTGPDAEIYENHRGYTLRRVTADSAAEATAMVRRVWHTMSHRDPRGLVPAVSLSKVLPAKICTSRVTW